MSEEIPSPPPEQMIEHLDGQIQTLLQENARWRAALECIANHSPNQSDVPHTAEGLQNLARHLISAIGETAENAPEFDTVELMWRQIKEMNDDEENK